MDETKTLIRGPLETYQGIISSRFQLDWTKNEEEDGVFVIFENCKILRKNKVFYQNLYFLSRLWGQNHLDIGRK